MSGKLILILEDNEDRIRNFQAAVKSLGENFTVRIWFDAPTMISEASSFLNQACLISLDHDLNPIVSNRTNAIHLPASKTEFVVH